MNFLRNVGLTLAFVMFLAAALLAQTGTSTIRGTITDPQGRVVPGASVTLTNLSTNAARTTQSTDTGAYSFDFILPGDYRVEVKSSGFKAKVLDKVHALVGKPTEANIQLEVGAQQETVEVTANAQDVLVNTQDASLGNVFVTQQIAQLPLEARSVVDLLSLQPGATREGYVTGARADQSNVTLDGVDINNAQTSNVSVPVGTNTQTIGGLTTDRGNITDGPVLRLNSLAIQEFRVTTANGNADQGRSAGSQINLVTKSGTNGWHGAAFEFYRSRGFTANDWFNNHATDANGNPAPIGRPPLVRNTFSGAIGGPIIKDRAFFFYSYEGRRDASAQAQTQVVPLPSLGQGVINYLYCTDAACNNVGKGSLNLSPGNPGPYTDAGINPLALSALAAAAAKYPANDTSQGDGLNTGGFRFNAATPVKLNSHVARLDFNLNSHQTAFARLNVLYDHQTLARYLPDSPAPLVWNHPWGLALGHTWTIGNRWVNNFRYGYTRQAFSELGDSFGNDISFRFVFQPNGQQHTLTRVTPVHNFTDDVSYMRGNHTLQFGVNFRKIDNNRVSFANAFDNAITNPSFYSGAGEGVSNQFQAYLDANNLPGSQNLGQALSSVSEVQNAATAIIGRFSQYTSNFTFGKDGALLSPGTPTVRNFATQAYDTYVQDSWKVRPRLTLTLGLRYSLERPVYETQGFEVQPSVPLGTYFQERQAAARNGTNFVDPIVINRSGPANGGKSMYNWDKNNFQPRIAFAWSLDSQAKSVLRGGFARTNDYYGEALAVDWDLNNTLGFTSNYTTPPNTFDTTVAGGLAPLFTGFDQTVQTLPGVVIPGKLTFPLQQPSDYSERIEQSVDSNLHAPTEY
ncbi:MAG TPA: TonB-dependent receptor, partial [Terriglobales bacterium]|nr:TonB-dependent receptor [Terriglobales bacterium]